MKINNFRNCFTHKSGVKAFTFVCLSGLTALGLAGCSDNDFDSAVNNQEKGTAVSFNVGVAGDNAQATRALTRAAYADQLSDFGLKPEDLVDQKLAVEGNSNYCLVETTLPGILNEDFEVNPATRADIVTTETLGKFSAIGSRGSSASALSSWFHNEEVAASGTFKNTFYWAMSQPYAKFYAIYPQMSSTDVNLKLSDQGTATPYVDVVVEENATDQKDLMTACTGETPVQYVTQGTAPVVRIKFQHAMTAIRFKVGENIAAGHNITKIEIENALSKGRFTLPSDVLEVSTGNLDRAWTDVKDRTTFKLAGISVSTAAENGIITGKDNRDNYTFYMIPQTLTGNDVKVKIYFDNSGSPAITSTLKGSWKAGTTKTYALSQKAGSFEYVLDGSSPNSATKEATATDEYRIVSYINENGVKKPVKWSIVGYKVNGIFSTQKPEWLTSLSRESGDGSISVAGETGTATITKNVQDLLAERNAALQAADAVTNYNLSNKTGAAAIENTANSYVISAPGTYRLPLVYGNAIKDGRDNKSAYVSTADSKFLTDKKTGHEYDEDLVLHKFVDHKDKEITSPYINVQNGSAPANEAYQVWSDVNGAISDLKIEKVGSTDFLTFKVNKDKLVNGNTVIAVRNSSTKETLWSWHLWTAPKTVLNTVRFESAGTMYDFAGESLGWKYTKWMAKKDARKVVAVVKQEVSGKEYEINIEQAGDDAVREGYNTLYQWGRKDAFPGIKGVSGMKFDYEYQIIDDNDNSAAAKEKMKERTIGRGIKNPRIMLPKVGGGKLSWQWMQLINLWSANNNKLDGTYRGGVKTIYDPSPVGFQIPDAYAYKDFKLTGAVWDKGYTFFSSDNKEIFFPAVGARTEGGVLRYDQTNGLYWTGSAALEGEGKLGFGYRARFYENNLNVPHVITDAFTSYAYAISVYPVASPKN